MTEPPAWVRYDARSTLNRVAGLCPLTELAHRRLADHLLAGQRLPARGDAVRILARCPPERWPACRASLRAIGWRLTPRGWSFPPARAASAARWSPPTANPPSSTDASSIHQAMLPASSSYPDKDKDKIKDKTKNQTLSAKALNVNPSTLSASPPKKELAQEEPKPRGPARPGEARFLAEVDRVFNTHAPGSGGRELAAWGGWWRNRFRQDPDKARRVLAEIGSMSREARITRAPGAAAFDLWNRLP